MKEENTNYYLNSFHRELGESINLMMNRIKTDNFPEGVVLYEYPIRTKNGFLRLGFNRDSGDFYLHGKDSDGGYTTIML